MGPSPHLWCLDAKQLILDQNYKSLWVPDLTNRFVHEKQRDLQRNDKSLLVQDPPVVFACKTATSGPE